MISLSQNNGALIPNGSSQPQRNASLNDIFLADQWLLSLGIPSEITADTLLGYAYMQRGIEQASLKFDPGSEDGKVRPSITYDIKLERKFGKRYQSMHKAIARGGIMGKLRVMWLLKRGTPLPGYLERAINNLARGYLPPNYQVVINVE